jgi:hypothetical protein
LGSEDFRLKILDFSLARALGDLSCGERSS